MNGLLSVSDAQQKLLSSFTPVDVSNIPVALATGRVLARKILSPMDLPPFANSSVDGFAVRSQDLEGAGQSTPIILPVIGDIAAGKMPEFSIGAGEAARIGTGAPIPENADSVIPVEDTDYSLRPAGTPAPKQVVIYRPVKDGENIRPLGQDLRAGQVVMQMGTRLTPIDIGLLAMIGLEEVPVYRRPRLAILSTGDELVPSGSRLPKGKIHDSNSVMLTALIEQYGGEVIPLGIAEDRAEAVKSLLDRAVEAGADLILSSAGVSVGAFDYLRAVVEQEGSISFWKVNMRPGKPLAYGHYRNIPLIGLPGNPVSAFVGFEVFVRPALLKLSGSSTWEHPVQEVVLAEPVESDGRESYLRGMAEEQGDRWIARLFGHQGSGNLYALTRANALLIIPSGVKSLPVGAKVKAWKLDK